MISDRKWINLLKIYLQNRFYQLSSNEISSFINDIYELTEKCKESLDITQNILKPFLETNNKQEIIEGLKFYNMRLSHMRDHVKSAKKILNKMIKIMVNEN